MNKQIIKQVVGIDVAQKELVVTLGRMYDDWTPELYNHQVFVNSTKGFGALVAWVKKQSVAEVPVQFVMEATGIYHEALAYYLDENGLLLSVVLPNKISNYFRSLTVKTVTDKTASQAIARFGLERKVDLWKRPLSVFKRLKQLTRERNQLIDTRTVMKNQLHAETSEAEPNAGTVRRIKKQIAFLNEQELEIREDIKEVVSQEPKVQAAVELITSIPGIGELTAITVLAETNGFELIRNKRQLASYAGLDVKEKQSGTSIKGKPRISKQGNKFLRRAMHLPALSAIRHDERFKAVFARLVGRHGIKMKAAVAIQRKLLEMTYILFRTNTPYDKTFLQQLQTAETIKN